jgi:indolepyruvate ferredoxin oxidoreductase
MKDPAVDLRDRLVADTGKHFMPGMQALMRLPLEQARRDHARGLRTGTLITGYPGSPIAGLDLQLAREPALLESLDIRHIPAGNEEQAVTALTGSQMLDSYPHERFDGVVGFWYGKGPGLDRAGDALKHGNFAGTSSCGAVVVLSGEDHEAKSSTMPFQQEYGFASAGIPILYPGTIADIRRLGLHAVEMSRFSGCWVALKLVSQVCDGGETLDLGEPVAFRVPELVIDGHRFEKRTDFTFYPGKNIEHERHLYAERHRAVLAYARANGLNRFESAGAGARVGIVSAGKSAVEVRQALADHGMPSDALAGLGICILDLGLIYPLDTDLVREFAAELDLIIVVEEKRDWLETSVRAAIQPLGRAIEVVGKYDASGRALFPVHGGMDADIIGECLARVLPAVTSQHDLPGRQQQLTAIRARSYSVAVTRAPNFCSGCPHNTSTRLADGQLAWGAPGCGAFNSVMEQPHRRIESMSQFGGEGAGWVGLAPFTERPHLTHNVGDGAMYHSSYLNVRWAAAVGTNITFKVLYNGAVANTGAQHAVGSRGVEDLVRGLSTEGVQRVIVISKTPEKYAGQDLGSVTSVRPAKDLQDASRELEETPGVTVLLYDETCANERRRQQKRGQLPKPTEHLFINEAVCEGCGDCGAKSNCMSLQRVDTEFGPKTQIHSSSCNDDYSCLEGDCPSFVTVKVAPGSGFRKPSYPKIDATRLPRPAVQRPTEPYHVYMPGVGGTGVITLNGILAVATQIDGMEALTYDQTGAAQKWGSVLSSLVIVPPGSPPTSNKVGLGRADVLIALDDVTAASAVNLDRCDPRRTALVHNTDLFATGEMVRDIEVSVDRSAIASLLHAWTTDEKRVEVPARHLAESLFGDYMLTNVIALGAAVQAGLVPVSVEALEQAISLNGVAVEANLAAFAVGRQWVVDPAGLDSDDGTHRSASDEVEFRAARIAPRDARKYRALVERTTGLDAEIQRLLAVRIAELLDYQPGPLAGRYVDRVLAVDRYEQQLPGAEGALTAAVARNLFRLLAYKDEYEVARMYLDRDFDDAIRERFESPLKVEYNLHPPFLRHLGREGKIAVGPWMRGPFRVLKAARRVRGTPFDPFGRQTSRREERELITWYDALLDRILGEISQATMPILVELAELPSTIRGYEQVKSRNAAKARRRADGLLRRLEHPDMTIVVQDSA